MEFWTGVLVGALGTALILVAAVAYAVLRINNSEDDSWYS